MTTFKTPDLPRVGFVSLGCPKATVDSEHILTRLRAEGYTISGSYDDALMIVSEYVETELSAPGPRMRNSAAQSTKRKEKTNHHER